LRGKVGDLRAQGETAIGPHAGDYVAFEVRIQCFQRICIVVGSRFAVDHIDGLNGSGGIAVAINCNEAKIEAVTVVGRPTGVIGVVAGGEIEDQRSVDEAARKAQV